jgi:hypothetical protein
MILVSHETSLGDQAFNHNAHLIQTYETGKRRAEIRSSAAILFFLRSTDVGRLNLGPRAEDSGSGLQGV